MNIGPWIAIMSCAQDGGTINEPPQHPTNSTLCFGKCA